MNAVIYARYSSHSQTEQSIEGQLKVCYEYAKQNGLTVVREYIDRAKTGTNANRAEFQQMIADSAQHTFERVIVYQLDRFARDRYDSASNKNKLKKNGVKVVSAKEQINDDPSGILIESVLEGMAEYYSAELSQKIHRGMDINAEKCLSNGSNPGLGYKVNKQTREFYVDPQRAAVVREIFQRYASGETAADIIRDLNARQIKTSQGREFNKNSLSRILRNRRYIGIYTYKGKETPGGMPRIIDDELFDRVQRTLDRNKAAPARSRGREEYLLTTKLFCGYCRAPMAGMSGISKLDRKYCYYSCGNRKHGCKKRNVDKLSLEDRVIVTCQAMLTNENIDKISAMLAAACEESQSYAAVKEIKAAIKETEQAIENLFTALEKGQAAEMIAGRIETRQQEKERLEGQLALELAKDISYSEQEVRGFLQALKTKGFEDVNKRRALINIFVKSIYLYDDKFTIYLNGTSREIVIDDIFVDKVESSLDSSNEKGLGSSCLVASAPPNVKYTNTMSRIRLAVYRNVFALIVEIDGYEGETRLQTKRATYKDLQTWVKERYGLHVSNLAISQTKELCGLSKTKYKGSLPQSWPQRKRRLSARRSFGSG